MFVSKFYPLSATLLLPMIYTLIVLLVAAYHGTSLSHIFTYSLLVFVCWGVCLFICLSVFLFFLLR